MSDEKLSVVVESQTVPTKTTAEISEIVAPTLGTIAYDTDLNKMFIYQTVTTTSYKQNSGVVDTTITSAAAWFPLLTGQNTIMVNASAQSGTTNWSATGGAVVSSTTGSYTETQLTSGNVGRSIIYTAPVAIFPVGLYKITWQFTVDSIRAVVDVGVSFNGGAYVNVAEAWSTHSTTSTYPSPQVMERYIPNTTPGSMSIRFLVNAGGGGGANYTIGVNNLKVVLLG